MGFLVQSSFVAKPGHLAPDPDSKCPGIRDDLTGRRPAHNMTTVNMFTVRESASNRSDGGQRPGKTRSGPRLFGQTAVLILPGHQSVSLRS